MMTSTRHISYISTLLVGTLASAVLIFLFLFSSVLAQDGGPNDGSGVTTKSVNVQFENPLAENTVEGILLRVLEVIRGIVGVLAVLFIVIGGILYITSGGNSSRTELAKAAIWAAVIGLAIAVAAPTFLREIYEALGGTAPGEGATAPTLAEIILNVLQVLLAIIGTLAITMLVVGGILYMSAGGDSNRIDTAKRTVIYAIIGLTVALISLVVVTQIGQIFS